MQETCLPRPAEDASLRRMLPFENLLMSALSKIMPSAMIESSLKGALNESMPNATIQSSLKSAFTKIVPGTPLGVR